jgi:hypothetical protein
VSNLTLQIVVCVILAAFLLALAAAVFVTKSAVPLMLVNLATALCVLVYLAVHPKLLAAPVDMQMLWLSAFELGVLTISILALRGVRFFIAPSCIIFALHFLAASAATAFAFLFKITRLF